MSAAELLMQIKSAYCDILQSNLVGIYIHGSLAFGCFTWAKSDIDFITVTENPLTQKDKEALISVLLHLDPYGPDKGFEMSVVSASACKSFVYPTPYELHFSNRYKERYQTDLTGLCRTLHGTDKDLAAHFTVIRQNGIVLYGKPIDDVFGDVPSSDYLDSILGDIGDADEGLFENPVYFILNYCRVLAYLENGIVVSKKDGGEWGLRNLPEEHHPTIQSALRDYCGGTAFDADCKAVRELIGYMKNRIDKIVKK